MAGFFDGLQQFLSSGFGRAIGSTAMSSLSGHLNQSLSAHRNARLDYETWKKKFDYSYEKNSPLSQRRRLEAAGLNPALMYQGGTGAGLSTSISQSTPSGQNVDVMSLARIENETKLADAQAAYYNSLAEGQGNENRTFDERFKEQMNLLKAQVRSENAKAYLDELEAIVANATGAARIEEAYQIVENLKKEGALTDEQIKEVTANIALKESTILLNNALAAKANSDIQVNEQQVRYLIAQTDFTYENGELVVSLKGKADAETHRIKITDEEYEFLLNWQGQLAKEEANLTDSERRLVNKQAAWMNKLNAAELTESYGGVIAELLKGVGAVMKAMR